MVHDGRNQNRPPLPNSIPSKKPSILSYKVASAVDEETCGSISLNKPSHKGPSAIDENIPSKKSSYKVPSTVEDTCGIDAPENSDLSEPKQFFWDQTFQEVGRPETANDCKTQ